MRHGVSIDCFPKSIKKGLNDMTEQDSEHAGQEDSSEAAEVTVVEENEEVVQKVADVGEPRAQNTPVQKQQSPVQKILYNEIQKKAASERSKYLRLHLLGTISLFFTDIKESYLCDWTGERLQVTEDAQKEADCKISLSSEVFLAIAEGKLNPQIAMLTNKIKVQSRNPETNAYSVYFFNLIT